MNSICIICGRTGVTIVGQKHCSACYPLIKRFKGNIEKERTHRKEHPVLERKKKTPGEPAGSSGRTGPKEPIALQTKVNYNESRKIKVQFELEIKVSNVKVIEWGKVS